MKKIQIYILIIIALVLGLSRVTFAADNESKNEGSSVGSHGTSHPPHDHQDNDHLKFIRGHGNERKKKVIKK